MTNAISARRSPTGICCALLLGLLVSLPSSASAQRVRIETTVENFVTTQFMIGCPSSDGDAAFVVDLMRMDFTNEQAEQLITLLDAFEAEHGVTISSRTGTIDFTTAFDNIRTISRGPLDKDGKALCDFLKTLQK